MLVFNQLIQGIIDINTVLITINNQKTFLIGEKKAIFEAHNHVQTLDSSLNHRYMLIRMTLIS